MKLLVTGGAGFIGSNLVDKLLAEGHEVQVVDNLSTGKLKNLEDARTYFGHKFTFFNLDIRQKEIEDLILIERPSVIFHLAAQSSVKTANDDPVMDFETNALGTLRVLNASAKAGVQKIIYAASGGTLYGEVDESKLPVSENQAFNPANFYGMSKKIGIDYLKLFSKMYELNFVALALANIYGPRQDPLGEAGVIAIFIQSLLDKRDIIIYGDGNQTRDFVFVDDVTEAFYKALGSDEKDLVLNIGTGVRTSVNEVLQIICNVLNAKVKPKYEKRREGDIRHISLDPLRASIRLNFKCHTSLEEGIIKTVNYFTQLAS